LNPGHTFDPACDFADFFHEEATQANALLLPATDAIRINGQV
jgi:hypothetical protein